MTTEQQLELFGDDAPFVVKEMLDKAALYKQRNEVYGDNYKRFGSILSLVMANQTLDCNDANLMNRLGIFVQVVSKVTRYGENFVRGGHDDSLDDMAVYSMMLKELDTEVREELQKKVVKNLERMYPDFEELAHNFDGEKIFTPSQQTRPFRQTNQDIAENGIDSDLEKAEQAIQGKLHG